MQAYSTSLSLGGHPTPYSIEQHTGICPQIPRSSRRRALGSTDQHAIRQTNMISQSPHRAYNRHGGAHTRGCWSATAPPQGEPEVCGTARHVPRVRAGARARSARPPVGHTRTAHTVCGASNKAHGGRRCEPPPPGRELTHSLTPSSLWRQGTDSSNVHRWRCTCCTCT